MSYSDRTFDEQRTSFPVRATVKWFNDTKGFGFVVPENQPIDAFLHITVLRQARSKRLAKAPRSSRTIGSGPKGPQVDSVLEIHSKGTPSNGGVRLSPYGTGQNNTYGHRSGPAHAPASGPVETLTGTVKMVYTNRRKALDLSCPTMVSRMFLFIKAAWIARGSPL